MILEMPRRARALASLAAFAFGGVSALIAALLFAECRPALAATAHERGLTLAWIGAAIAFVFVLFAPGPLGVIRRAAIVFGSASAISVLTAAAIATRGLHPLCDPTPALAAPATVAPDQAGALMVYALFAMVVGLGLIATAILAGLALTWNRRLR